MPVDVEIPTTVIGLVAFMFLLEGYVIYHLLKQLSDLNNKYIELLTKVLEGIGTNTATLDKLTQATEGALSGEIKALFERVKKYERE